MVGVTCCFGFSSCTRVVDWSKVISRCPDENEVLQDRFSQGVTSTNTKFESLVHGNDIFETDAPGVHD